MIVRLATYLFALLLLSLNSCTDRSDDTPLEKAEQLSRDAAAELQKTNYKNAERLLLESIEIYSAANNNTKLTEQYASLATVQTLAGKLSPALRSLYLLRSSYKQNADRNAELNTMLEIARIADQLGKPTVAIETLDEVYLTGQLFQLKKQYARSAQQLGALYAHLDRHTKATQYFSQAAAQFLQLADTANAAESLIGALSSSLQRNNTTAAMQYLVQCEILLQSKRLSSDGARLYALCGFALMQGEEWERAAWAFKKSLAVQHTHSSSAFLPHFGLGEVLYRNYAFDDAQQSFVRAYKSGKEASAQAAQAYALIRIADCEIKKNISFSGHEQSIRASQLLEHAQTLCSRAGFGFGEAVVLYRMGMVKELSGDDYSAVTYYKRAFEKFAGIGLNPPTFHPAVDFRDLISTSQFIRLEQQITSPLISLLLKQRKYSDALEFAERTTIFSLQQTVMNAELRFGGTKKQQAVQNVRTAFDAQNEIQHSLFFFPKTNDNEYAVQLQHQFLKEKNTFAAASSALAQSNPEFSFLNSKKTTVDITNAYLPEPVTALRYYFSGNEAWVFVIRRNEEVKALKLSSFGLTLKKKMNRFVALLSTPGAKGFELTQLSNELYAILIQPVERFEAQRFLIIPPDECEKFPFHALTKYGRSFIEMNEVSYLPSLYFLTGKKPVPQFITNVVAAGFSPDARWGLEFALRDVRSFFKNAKVIVNQNATILNLRNEKGEFLHIASPFSSTQDNELAFTLSDGTSSILGMNVSITQFATLHSFPFVYLADINAKSNAITREHPLLWMLNGSQSIVVNQFPVTPKLHRAFNEELYSTYAATFRPYEAYREAMITLSRQKEFSEGMLFASYFYYGL